MYFITTKRMLEVCFSAHPNIQYRTPFSASLSGIYQADAETIVQNYTEENSRLHIRFQGDRIESPEIRKQK
jgi:hypothetical protein